MADTLKIWAMFQLEEVNVKASGDTAKWVPRAADDVNDTVTLSAAGSDVSFIEYVPHDWAPDASTAIHAMEPHATTANETGHLYLTR